MPIGTSNTANIYNVQKPTKLSNKQKEDNLLKEILDFIGIQAVAIALSFAFGFFAYSIGIGLGWTNFGAGLLRFGVSTSIDFGVNQTADKLTETDTKKVTWKTTLLNLTTGLGGIGQLTRAARTTKILRLAKQTKLLEKLGITSVQNMEDLIKQVMGKKVLTSNKFLFDFTKAINSETIINNIGLLARNDFYKGFKTVNFDHINKLLELERNIKKINPKLIQKIPRLNKDRANKYLKEFGLDVDTITKISTDKWYSIMSQLHKKGIGKNLLYVNSIRSSEIYSNKLLSYLSKANSVINSVFNFLNPTTVIKKTTKKLFHPIEKRIVELKQKVAEKINNSIQKLFKKFELKAIQKAKLIPFAFGSDVFLGVKITPLSVAGEVALTVYYKIPKYEPLIIMTTQIQAEKFILAKEPFNYYMNSEWFIGWGTTKGGLFNLVNFAPVQFQRIITNSFKTYRLLMRILKFREQAKDKFKSDFKNTEKMSETFIDSVFESILGGGFFVKFAKEWRTKKQYKKRFGTEGKSFLKKGYIQKIKRKKNRW